VYYLSVPFFYIARCADDSLTAPERIKTATLLLAKWLYRQKNATSEADNPIVAQGGFIIMPSKLPSAFWDMVSGYKRR
jgi:hypothetical protein